jgi:hypothetical protein
MFFCIKMKRELKHRPRRIGLGLEEYLGILYKKAMRCEQTGRIFLSQRIFGIAPGKQ